MMKHTGHRMIPVLLAAAMTCTLLGCRPGEGNVKLVEKPTAQTVIHLFSTAGIFSVSNQAKYWSENFAQVTGIDAVIDYEEGWYYAEDRPDGRRLLRTRIESEQPDDLYIVHGEDMIDFARKGYLLDLSAFDFVNNLSDSARQLSTIDGKVYCLPLSFTGFGLYWNVDLLKQYGLNVPQNYEELIRVWDTLLAKGKLPYAGNKGYALSVPVMCLSLAEVYQSGEKDRLIAELADGTTPISTYARKGFAFLQLMCDKGYLDPQAALETVPSDEKEVSQFVSGNAACVCSIMGTKPYCDAKETGFAVQMTGWPLLDEGEIAVVGTDQKLCVNPKSQHLDIVTAFIEMAGSEAALMQCTEEGKVSAGKVNNPAKYIETGREFAKLIQTDGQVPNTDMNLKLNLWEDMRDISRLILSGDATVDEACRLLDKRQLQEIAEDQAAQ